MKVLRTGMPPSYGTLFDSLLKNIANSSIQSRKFFKLDEKSKQVAAHPAAPNPHRGYSFVGQENTSGLSRYKNTDQTPKRFFDIKVR